MSSSETRFSLRELCQTALEILVFLGCVALLTFAIVKAIWSEDPAVTIDRLERETASSLSKIRDVARSMEKEKR